MTEVQGGRGEISRLEDAYELGDVLGEGGFGVVYTARHRGDGTPAAVKLARGTLDRDMARRILREASLARGLDHPGLVRFLGVHLNRDGHLALAYELVPGETLEEHLGRPLGPERWVPWARDLAGALDALHQRGLVHRDLKAENVMVTPPGRLRLLDFGLLRGSASGGTLTATGMILGTPRTMAPELFRGEAATPASDHYALACLLHRLIRGRPPLDGSPGELMELHLSGRSAPLERALESLPPGLGPVFRDALSPDPARRPRTAASLVQALEKAQAQARSEPGGTRALAGGDRTKIADHRDRDRETRVRPSPGPGPGDLPAAPPGPAVTERPVAPVPSPAPPGGLGREEAPGETRGRPGIWAAVLLLGVALGFAAGQLGEEGQRSLPPRMDSGPSPVPQPEPGGRGAAVLAEIQDLVEARMDESGERLPAGVEGTPVLGDDPLGWHLSRRHLPATRKLWEALHRGLDPARLGEGEHADLAEAEALCREYGFPELVAPWFEEAPPRDPAHWTRERTPELARQQVLVGRGEELAGWPTEALVRWKRLRDYLAEREKEFQDPGSRLYREFGHSLDFNRLGRFPVFVARSGIGFARRRRDMRRWLVEGDGLARRLLLVLGRALTSPEPSHQDLRPALTRLFQRVAIPTLRPFLHAAITLPGLPVALGAEPDNPCAALLSGRIAQAWRRRVSYYGPSRAFLEEAFEQELAWFRQASVPGGRKEARWVRNQALAALTRLEGERGRLVPPRGVAPPRGSLAPELLRRRAREEGRPDPTRQRDASVGATMVDFLAGPRRERPGLDQAPGDDAPGEGPGEGSPAEAPGDGSPGS